VYSGHFIVFRNVNLFNIAVTTHRSSVCRFFTSECTETVWRPGSAWTLWESLAGFKGRPSGKGKGREGGGDGQPQFLRRG